VQALLAGLEATPLAVALRGSVWLYPLVNTAHLLGIALLFGAIAALDLRLIGAWRGVPAATLARVLAPVATAGLALAAAAGALLFIAKATDYAASGLFQAKLVVIGLAVANAAAAWSWGRRLTGQPTVPARLRLGAAASLGLWLAAITLGRLVGYF
jgi:hypothetical protein